MINLNLDCDESVILKCDDVTWDTHDDVDLTDFVLTNRSLYCVFKKSNGFLKKRTEELCKFSLSDIKIDNGQALVRQVKYEGSWCLQIHFRQGVECFSFTNSPKKAIPQWIAAINNILGVSASENVMPNVIKRNGFLGGTFAEMADSFIGAIDTASETLGISYKQSSKQSAVDKANMQTKSIEPFNQSLLYSEAQTIGCKFCVNCGSRLTPNAKFCPNCGVNIAEPTVSPPAVSFAPTNNNGNSEIRQQEYAGKIIKCPNCGQPIGNTDVICPSCGHQITGRSASSSVQHLVSELMAIEYSRRERNAIDALVQSFTGDDGEETAICNKKITLIKNFPIPNTIEEITEFIVLAAGNIDVNLSKSSFGNKLGRAGNDFKANERGLSDAWVGKLQQAYQKAELMFADMPIFSKVHEIYVNKMIELNMIKKRN